MELHRYFEYDDGLLMNRAGHIYCNLDRDGYIRVRVSGREYRAHRLIWEMFNGPIPDGLLVDHIDGDIFNNRIENLRLATRQQNNNNSRSRTEALPKGVVRVGRKYRARLGYNGKTLCLGTYNTIEEAKAAYDKKALELHGEFARV